MKKLLLLSIILIVGCAPYPQSTSGTTSTTSTTSTIQNYNLVINIQDNSNNPITNTKVVLQRLNSKLVAFNPDTLFSDSLGKISIKVSPIKEEMTFNSYALLMEYDYKTLQGLDYKTPDILKSLLTTTVYHYLFDISIIKDGFYNFSKRQMKYGLSDEQSDIIVDIKLTKPSDWFAVEFINSDNNKLNKTISSFIEILRMQSYIQSAELKLFSINKIEFKEQPYLKIGFEHQVIFNSLKLDKYAIGRIIFDDVIRKILSPLNEYIYSPDDFWGYDLTIDGKTKDFTKKTKLPTNLNYRFLIPAETVKSYKNLDITGQDVLDASYILMDGERIKLQLQ